MLILQQLTEWHRRKVHEKSAKEWAIQAGIGLLTWAVGFIALMLAMTRDWGQYREFWISLIGIFEFLTFLSFWWPAHCLAWSRVLRPPHGK